MKFSASLSALFLLTSTLSADPPHVPEKLIGKWKLVEYCADIGDGKVNWQKASSSQPRTIEFKADGAYVETDNSKIVKSVMSDKDRFLLEGKDGKPSYPMTIVKLGENNLELRPNSIEGSGEKYVKVK